MSTSFPVGDVRVRFAGATHMGMKRDHNEDALYLPEQERLCLVADGMGGHASGEVASTLSIATIVDYFRATADEVGPTWPFSTDRVTRIEERRLGAAIRLANARILEKARSDARYQGMGTTVVAAYFGETGAFVAHVGDSRIYRLRDGVLDQLTEDHSLLSEYIALGRVTAEDAANFPQKNVIVRALGMREMVRADVRRVDLRVGDVFLLCTDGLSGMIDDAAIRAILLAVSDVDRVCAELVDAANRAGGADNVTVAVARVEAA
ncbi:MAG: Stp1/IreP family PP2C-type Ser/Thr phosphatase [Myxococcota bacterium]